MIPWLDDLPLDVEGKVHWQHGALDPALWGMKSGPRRAFLEGYIANFGGGTTLECKMGSQDLASQMYLLGEGLGIGAKLFVGGRGISCVFWTQTTVCLRVMGINTPSKRSLL